MFVRGINFVSDVSHKIL